MLVKEIARQSRKFNFNIQKIDIEPSVNLSLSFCSARGVSTPRTPDQGRRADDVSVAKSAPETFKDVYRLRRPLGSPSARSDALVAYLIVARRAF